MAVEDDEEDDYGEDPSEIILEASTMLYQLQNTWLEERRDEVKRLWKQLEGEYGFSIPEADALQQELVRCIGGGSSGSGAAALGRASTSAPSCPSLPGAGGSAGGAPDERGEPGAHEATAAVLGRAANDLEAARILRRRWEEELLERRARDAAPPPLSPPAADRPSSSSSSAPPPRSTAGVRAVEDSERMLELRREIRRLREREDRLSAPSTFPDAGAVGNSGGAEGLAEGSSGSWRGGQAPAAAGDQPSRPRPPPLLDSSLPSPPAAPSALDRWLEDLRLLEVVGGASSPSQASSQARASPCSGGRASAAASSSAPPLSRRARAQAAEAKALEWAASSQPGRGGGRATRPSQAVPSPAAASSLSATVGRAMPAGDSLSAAAPSRLGLGSAVVAVGAAAVAAPPPVASDRHAAGDGGNGDGGEVEDESALASRQLDDMLRELDEIDRIHGDICRITRY